MVNQDSMQVEVSVFDFCQILFDHRIIEVGGKLSQGVWVGIIEWEPLDKGFLNENLVDMVSFRREGKQMKATPSIPVRDDSLDVVNVMLLFDFLSNKFERMVGQLSLGRESRSWWHV